ncbi:octaprenyl diphosphate synthase, partial [Achromobacter ruhlandii]|nr:octaprenyl diphosphate synthase [Achromobacter ruhlandii]
MGGDLGGGGPGRPRMRVVEVGTRQQEELGRGASKTGGADVAAVAAA